MFKLGYNLANGYEIDMIIILIFEGYLNKCLHRIAILFVLLQIQRDYRNMFKISNK